MKILLFLVNVFALLWAIEITHIEDGPRYRILNDGNIIPTVALGTYTKHSNRENVRQAVIWALEAGYRHIDTDDLYIVEDVVGEAIINATSRGILTREELFLTTKLNYRVNRTEGVVPALKNTLKMLQLDYVDLFLIHFPYDVTGQYNYDILALWRGLEEARKLELARSIGVSNFNSTHINKLLTYTDIRPAVNQIEVNPTYTDLELVAYCQRQGIMVMSYGPHGFMVPRTYRDVSPPPKFDDPILTNIANKYGKSTNQVVLRYLIDRGTILIPQSVNKEHIEENIDLFDFSLTNEEVYIINEFNKNEKVYVFSVNGLVNSLEYFYGTEFDVTPLKRTSLNEKKNKRYIFW